MAEIMAGGGAENLIIGFESVELCEICGLSREDQGTRPCSASQHKWIWKEVEVVERREFLVFDA